jgi:hypothetical protein
VNTLALLSPTFQQDDGGGIAAISNLISLVFTIYGVVCLWKIFQKAREPGWQAIIPIWNYLVLLKISGKPWWWILLLLIPVINLVIIVMATIALGKTFGKSAVFSFFLLFLLSPIGMGILAFGDSRYVGTGDK